MTRHPILVGLSPAIVTALIAAVANFANLFGLASFSKEQVDAINTLALTLLVLFGIGGVGYAQNKSTPTDSPRLDKGTEVEVVTPPDQPNEVVVL